MLEAEAAKARARQVDEDVPRPTGRKPTASVRLPPVPARKERDLAAARRQTTSGDTAPKPAAAPGSGPAGLPAPITAAAKERSEPVAMPAGPASVSAPVPEPAPKQPEPKPKQPEPKEPEPKPTLDPKPATAADEIVEVPNDDLEPIEEEASTERVDPSEPVLLSPTQAAPLEEWPEPEGVRIAKREAGEASDEVQPHEWPTPEPSDNFSTPPTRTQLSGTRSKSPSVDPIPEAPEGGIWQPVRYLINFGKARWQRRGAIKVLKEQITSDTTALDAVLGDLGASVRGLGLDNRALSAENAAIGEAEERKSHADREFSEQQNRQAEENNRFAEIESDRQAKVDEASTTLEAAKRELGSFEAQRRGLREKRKGLQRQQDGLVKAAEDRESKASKLSMGDERAGLRRSSEELRREAAGLDPDRQDLDRRLGALDKPLSVATAKVEALKAELESAKRSLNDVREGHRHKQSEIESEKGKKSRELAQADAEIKRRLVTLGTIVNLNRIDRDEFVETYVEIDVLRNAIGSRTNEIDRLSVERDAYDKQALTRGGLILAGAILALCILVAILIWSS